MIGKDEITPTLSIDGNDIPVPNFTDYKPTTELPMPREQENATRTGNCSYSVYDLALCRSGDKDWIFMIYPKLTKVIGPNKGTIKISEIGPNKGTFFPIYRL